MATRIKEGPGYDARRAHALAHGPGAIASVGESRVEYFCRKEHGGCGFADHGWHRKGLPEGWNDLYKCPACGSWMRTQKMWDRIDGNKEPDCLPNCHGEWEPFWLENVGHRPILVEGRKEYARILQEHGLMNQHGVGRLGPIEPHVRHAR